MSQKKYGVLGLGFSGYWAAQLILEKIKQARVCVVDHDPQGKNVQERAEHIRKLGGECLLGPSAIMELKRGDTLVLSPGVDIREQMAGAMLVPGLEIIGELELAWRFSEFQSIGVTGTNGKSTTVKMIEKILNDQGVSAVAAGNIGYPLSQLVLEKPDVQVAVIEVSSFQLEHTRELCFDCAMLIDLSEDHLDRYESFQDYGLTKMKIFNRQKEGGLSVIYKPVLDRFSCAPQRGVKRKVVDENGSCRDESLIVSGKQLIKAMPDGEKRMYSLDSLPFLGRHNVRNAVFAMIGSDHFGADFDSAWTSLRSFKPLPHRLEIFHRWRGITFVDDSKSTTPSSTLEAVFSFHDPVRLILGGRGKGADFHVLRAMKKRDVLEIFVIGETREILIDALGDIFPVTSADSLQEATALAIRHAKSGDVILLSPACASFDMFESFKARGEAFKSAVQQIAA